MPHGSHQRGDVLIKVPLMALKSIAADAVEKRGSSLAKNRVDMNR